MKKWKLKTSSEDTSLGSRRGNKRPIIISLVLSSWFCVICTHPFWICLLNVKMKCARAVDSTTGGPYLENDSSNSQYSSVNIDILRSMGSTFFRILFAHLPWGASDHEPWMLQLVMNPSACPTAETRNKALLSTGWLYWGQTEIRRHNCHQNYHMKTKHKKKHLFLSLSQSISIDIK